MNAAVFVVCPVPPYKIATGVAFHVPDVTVSKVVMFVDPDQVDRAVFSTFPRPTSLFVTVTFPERG